MNRTDGNKTIAVVCRLPAGEWREIKAVVQPRMNAKQSEYKIRGTARFKQNLRA